MNCIIIDDEYPARLLLEGYVSKTPYLSFLKSFRNPAEAESFIKEIPVDLMFVDIEMPQVTGTTFLRNLKERPAAILTTAYPDYALESYELDVIDYLVKPIPFERFLKATDKAHQRFEQDNFIAAKVDNFILLKADHKIHKVAYNDILFVEGAREYVTFHTVTGKMMTLESLRRLEDVLPSQFIRIHKSYIINKDKITMKHGRQAVQVDRRILPVGKLYRNQVEHIFSS